MLEVENLVCSRGDRPLFRAVTFSVETGQLLHVRGPNGCGKTTLLRTLCGLTRPASGEIRWRHQPIGGHQAEFGAELLYVGHANALHGELTGAENLTFEGTLTGHPDIDATTTLDALGLGRVAHLPVKLLSQGQRRRTALARLQTADKPLWILDEPLAALDTNSVRELLAHCRRHLAGGGLIVMTSHQNIEIASYPVRELEIEPQ